MLWFDPLDLLVDSLFVVDRIAHLLFSSCQKVDIHLYLFLYVSCIGLLSGIVAFSGHVFLFFVIKKPFDTGNP